MNRVFQSAMEVRSVLPQDKKFTLVGGCFDLIHVGHIHFLEYAASLEKLLVIAVRSDKYVQGYKGPQRPIINQKHRAEMVMSIRFVDFVYIATTSPYSPVTLKLLKPDSILFGEESNNTRRIQEWIKIITHSSPHTKIQLLPRMSKKTISTSHIINRIKDVII